MAKPDPPAAVIKIIQRFLVDFFWSGQHWLRESVLYLAVQRGLLEQNSNCEALNFPRLQKTGCAPVLP
ncbi:mucolipin-1b [Tachysurus ichikawai]